MSNPAPKELLAELTETFWEQRMRASPVWATALGDRRYDHLLSDLSLEATEAERAELATLLGAAREIDPKQLGAQDRVTRGELIGALTRDLTWIETGLDVWSVNPMHGPQLSLLHLPDLQPLRSAAEAKAYVQRIAAMPSHLDQYLRNLRRGLAEGKVAPRRPVERSLAQLLTLLARPAEEWSLLQHLRGPIPGIPPRSLAAHRRRATALVEDAVRPAFSRLADCLREQILPAARPDEKAGLLHLPGGAGTYARIAEYHTSLDLTPERIHELGLTEIARIRDEMATLGARALGTKDLAELQARLRTDPALHFASAEQIEQKARDAVARAAAEIPRWFGRLPKAPCEVRPIPELEAPDSTIAYYRGPAPDGSRPGVYYVNTHAPATRPRYEAEVLAFHEAIPGHHLQIAIAQEIAELPAFRRHGGVTAYVEGWALYTERLADEMGLYSDDLDRIGMLSFDAWRACRLVVDTGLHALGWDRTRAIEFMKANTVLAENNIANEVDRYIVTPGQALSYKLGQFEILRLRDRAKARLGAAFDLPGFHDRMLENGAVSLSVLAAQVEAWSPGAG